MEELIQAISTVGFPIVMCLILLKQNTELKDVVNNNTIILEKILTKLEMDDNK